MTEEYKRLLRFIRPHIWILALGIGAALVSQLLQGVSIVGILVPTIDKIVAGKEIVLTQSGYTPAFLVSLVDKVNAMSPAKLINSLLLVFSLALFTKPLFDFLHSFFMKMLSEKVMRNLRDKLFNKLMTLSFSFFAKTPTGKLVSKITYDVTVLKNSLTQGLMTLIMQPMTLLVNIGVMLFIKFNFNISWRWIITGVVLLPTVIYPVRVIGKRLRKIATSMQEKMGDINVILYEAISGIRIVKAFRMEGYEKSRFNQQNKNFYKMSMKSIKRTLAVRPITEGVSILCVVLLIWSGRKDLLSGTFSFGAFAALLIALMQLMKPIKALSRVYGDIQQAMSAAARIFEVLDTEEIIKEKPGAVTMPEIKSNIEFKNVAFKYQTDIILSDVNLKVKKGEIVAIVGSSGTGKTTLVNLIPRFYDVTGGSITIDGEDTRDATLDSLRAQIGIVTQDLILFNDTIKFNIGYGKGNDSTDESRIIDAAKVANAHEFIMQLPNGYDTHIGEKGVRLSGGQKQRIAIARAMFKNPPILILDEATSQLDTESERLVQEALNRLMEGRTVFVIAHRLSTIKHATKIVTLDGGIVKESGTHDELMEADTLYKKLYNLQFKDF